MMMFASAEQMVERDVLVFVKGADPVRYNNAWIQADDSTVLIRQRHPDQTSAWETTAVYAPGSYIRVVYLPFEKTGQRTGLGER